MSIVERFKFHMKKHEWACRVALLGSLCFNRVMRKSKELVVDIDMSQLVSMDACSSSIFALTPFVL